MEEINYNISIFTNQSIEKPVSYNWNVEKQVESTVLRQEGVFYGTLEEDIIRRGEKGVS